MKKIAALMLALVMALTGPGFAATNFATFRKTVASAGTREALRASSTPFTTADICAETDNTGNITVGGSAVVASLATRQGVPLAAGDCYSINPTLLGVADLKDVYIDSTVNGDGVTVMYFMEEQAF